MGKTHITPVVGGEIVVKRVFGKECGPEWAMWQVPDDRLKLVFESGGP